MALIRVSTSRGVRWEEEQKPLNKTKTKRSTKSASKVQSKEKGKQAKETD